MSGSLELQSAPAVEPISLDEAKAHLRVDSSDEDDLITSLIQAAREYAEEFLGRALITQTWDWYLDDFPSSDSVPLYVPKPPLQSVMSIQYVDSNGDTQTWDSSEYDVDVKSDPGRIAPAYGESYPDPRDQLNAVTIRFTAGYGDSASDVPQRIRQALLLILGHWYENRAEVVIGGGSVVQVPLAAQALLWQDRILRFD